MNITKNVVRVFKQGTLVDSIIVNDSTTPQELASLAKVSIADAQSLLSTRVVPDINSICCDASIPIVNNSTYFIDYNTKILSITTNTVNDKTDNYTVVSEINNTEVLNYTGDDFTITIPNIQFNEDFPHDAVITSRITSTNCASSEDRIETEQIPPDFVLGNITGVNTPLIGNIKRFGLAGLLAIQLNSIFSVNSPVEIRYYVDGQEYKEDKIVSSVTATDLNFSTPFLFSTTASTKYPTRLVATNKSTNGTLEFGNDLSYNWTL